THPSPPDLYTLSLHDALPIWPRASHRPRSRAARARRALGLPLPTLLERPPRRSRGVPPNEQKERLTMAAPEKNPSQKLLQIKVRSEEHTSELQSRGHLVCRLL